jgi:hypothetical protein
MSELVTLLKHLIEQWFWWVTAPPAIIWGGIKGYWEIRKSIAETKLAETRQKIESRALKVSDFVQLFADWEVKIPDTA